MFKKIIDMVKELVKKGIILGIYLTTHSSFAMAYVDPATKSATKMRDILFGTLGTSLAAILIGATFILAYVGKTTWDRFIFVGFCSAGFLGSQSIVSLIQGWVS